MLEGEGWGSRAEHRSFVLGLGDKSTTEARPSIGSMVGCWLCFLRFLAPCMHVLATRGREARPAVLGVCKFWLASIEKKCYYFVLGGGGCWWDVRNVRIA